jgi:GNAT superfamily N-acetyltransferase
MSPISHDDLARACAAVALPSSIAIRAWDEGDYVALRDLAAVEGWTTLRDRPADGLHAWQNSWPALVATHADDVVGFLRGLTDGAVTLYVADLLVAPAWRGRGVATALLEVCHALYPTARFDLLSTDMAHAFYERLGYRPFPGFRKSYV